MLINKDTDIEIIENDIELYSKMYIESLNNPDDIYNSSLFTGMIKYIYKHIFKPNKNDKVYNYTGSNIDLSDIELLDNIWSMYTDLCYRYKKRPSILNFCIMIGIDPDTVQRWRDGVNRAKTSPEHSTTAKKWYKECESSLLDGATENNSIGCIFALKANYGYTDSPQQVIITNGSERISSAEIAQRHAGAALPDDIEKPNI